MKLFGKRITLLAILAVVSLTLTGVRRSRIPLTVSAQQAASDDELPVVDYEKTNKTPTRKDGKHRRGLRQDKSIAELPAGIEPLPMSSHWSIGLPALPVAKSDAVVLVEVTGRQANLTDDKLGIYSEFSLCVETVYLDRQALLAPGAAVTATRLGGAVRFASGRVQRYMVSKQGYPRLGKHYVLFLKRDEAGDFSILTGYEIRDGLVLPLDGDSRDSQSDLQFGIYRGMSQESFFNDLLTVLASPEVGGGSYLRSLCRFFRLSILGFRLLNGGCVLV